MTTPVAAEWRTDDEVALHAIIARVLMVPVAAVQPGSDLVYDLGAESIDFLDLLFSMDELVGRRVLPESWGAWLSGRLPDMVGNRGITAAIVGEFARHQRSLHLEAAQAGGAA